METKIIKVGTSLGMIIPGKIAKEYELQQGSKMELSLRENGEIIIKKKNELREGWAAAFAKYATEGEEELMLPDFLDSEAEEFL